MCLSFLHLFSAPPSLLTSFRCSFRKRQLRTSAVWCGHLVSRKTHCLPTKTIDHTTTHEKQESHVTWPLIFFCGCHSDPMMTFFWTLINVSKLAFDTSYKILKVLLRMSSKIKSHIALEIQKIYWGRTGWFWPINLDDIFIQLWFASYSSDKCTPICQLELMNSMEA